MPYGNRLVDHNHVTRVPLLRLDSTGEISSDILSNVNMNDHSSKRSNNCEQWFNSRKVELGNLLNKKMIVLGGNHLAADTSHHSCKIDKEFVNKNLIKDSHPVHSCPQERNSMHQECRSIFRNSKPTFHPAVVASSFGYSVPSTTAMSHQSYIPKMTYCNLNRCYQNKFKQKFLNSIPSNSVGASRLRQSHNRPMKRDKMVMETKTILPLNETKTVIPSTHDDSSPELTEMQSKDLENTDRMNDSLSSDLAADIVEDGQGENLDIFKNKMLNTEVVNNWLDLCSDDESDHQNTEIPDSWDEENLISVNAKISEENHQENSPAGKTVDNASPSCDSQNCNISECKNTLETCEGKNMSCKNERSASLKIQISPLKSHSSETGDEKENSALDKSFVLYVRKDSKKCRPSAKKRQRSKAKKSEEEINTHADMISKLSPPKCQKSSVSFMFGLKHQSETELNEQPTHSFYIQTFEDESEHSSDWSEDEGSDQCDNENWSDDLLDSEFESPLNLEVICSVKPVKSETNTMSQELKDLNLAWQVQISRKPSSSSLNKEKRKIRTDKKVHFPENGKLAKVYSLDSWIDEYQDSRKGPWEQYALDHERFQRRIEETGKVLTPVLLPEHRNQVYQSLTKY